MRKYLRKTHLFSGVEDNIQILTEAKGEVIGQACRALTFLNCADWVRDGDTIISESSEGVSDDIVL